MAKVVWSPTALADLETLMEYIANESPLTAVRFGEKIIERVEQLPCTSLP